MSSPIPPPLAGLHVLDDAALVDRARRGEMRAFQVLVERHQASLRQWLRRVAPPGQADDVAQEALVKAWRGLARWDMRGSFRSWLFAIASHAAADARRTDSRAVARDTSWAAERSGAHPSPASAVEAARDVERILAALPPAQRDVVALCYGSGFSHQEAADALGLPLGTVKSHALRGRQTALSLLEPQSDPTDLSGQERKRL